MSWVKITMMILALLHPGACWGWSGQVVDVHDGDSLRVRRDNGEVVKIRIYGVDCPELGQPYGEEARDLTARRVLDQRVEVAPTGQRPSYGREVAVVVLLEHRTELQEALVTAGLAWVDGRFCKSDICAEWRILQKEARADGCGLWSDPSPVPPWIWRRLHRR